MDTVLEQVRDFADSAHGTETRKYSPERYIVHPVRVMEICATQTSDRPVLAAALLHDVLEDTSVDRHQLHQFLASLMDGEEAQRTLKLVVELTDVYTKPSFPRWNRRKRKAKEAARIQKTSAESQTVKYADIIDNCREITVADPDFAGVFLCECRMLLRKMPLGNATLYQQAIDTVEQCLQELRKARS